MLCGSDSTDNILRDLTGVKMRRDSRSTVGTVETFEGNLSHLLSDVGAGSIMLVLGGRGGEYPTIYNYVDRLAGTAGFERRIENQSVSSAETALSDLVYEAFR